MRTVEKESLRPLMELPGYKREVAREGFRWMWIVIEKELRVSLKLTKEGKDVKFASGDQLDRCVRGLNAKVAR